MNKYLLPYNLSGKFLVVQPYFVSTKGSILSQIVHRLHAKRGLFLQMYITLSANGKVFFATCCPLIANTLGMVPNIRSQQDLVIWAKNLIEGEEKRLAKNAEGKATARPMSNPRISEVENEFNKYIELSNIQSAEKQAFDAENKDVLDMLPEMDELIRDIYDEVEFYYRKETPANKRKLAREWGAVYISRKGEDSEEGVVEEVD